VDEVLIRAGALDEAARYVMRLQNADLRWERISPAIKDEYRDQVLEVLKRCGLQLPGAGPTTAV